MTIGIVEVAKSARLSLTNRLMPQRVVFHHVPKCGGTSVARALRKRFILSQASVLPEESFRAFEAFTGRRDRERMLVDVLDLREQMLLYLLFENVRCIALHVRFSKVAYETFRDRYKFVTILREPISRFLSHYRWSSGRPGAHAHIADDFPTFLESDRARRLGASYVEYFCGLPKETDITTSEAISAAIENLSRFDLVGRLDDTPAFERGIRQKLGVRIRVGHENANRSFPTYAGYMDSPPVRAKVEELCAPDIAVWKAVTT